MTTSGAQATTAKASGREPEVGREADAHISEGQEPSLAVVMGRARQAPRGLTTGDILRLHRTIGNRSVQRLLTDRDASRPGLPDHRKAGSGTLSGMAMGEIQATEAEPIAVHVTDRNGGFSIQRKLSTEEQQSFKPKLQGLEKNYKTLANEKEHLPEDLRRRLEQARQSLINAFKADSTTVDSFTSLLNQYESILNKSDQFKQFNQILKAEYEDAQNDKSNVSNPVRNGLTKAWENLGVTSTDNTTTVAAHDDLLDRFSGKMDQVKQLREALIEAKRSKLKSTQAQSQLEKRIDALDFWLEYDKIDAIFAPSGEGTLYALLKQAHGPQAETGKTQNKGQQQKEQLTGDEQFIEDLKNGPGSLVGFSHLIDEKIGYTAKLWREDTTYVDPERTQPKDKVRMYEIQWAASPKSKQQHKPWILHIHFTLQDKLTVAHFKRYKTHAAGPGTNLTNYDANAAKILYDSVQK